MGARGGGNPMAGALGGGNPRSTVSISSEEPSCKLHFYSLKTRSISLQLDQQDLLLDYDPIKGELVTLGLEYHDQTQNQTDAVTKWTWNGTTNSATKVATFMSTAQVCETKKIRQSLLQSLQVKYLKSLNRLVLCLGFETATVFEMRASTDINSSVGKLVTSKIVTSGNRIHILQGDSEE